MLFFLPHLPFFSLTLAPPNLTYFNLKPSQQKPGIKMGYTGGNTAAGNKGDRDKGIERSRAVGSLAFHRLGPQGSPAACVPEMD